MKRSIWLAGLAVLVAGFVIVAGCQSSGTSGTTGGTSGTTTGGTTGGGTSGKGFSGPGPREKASIKIANFAFSPASVTVAKGGKVTWTNKDSTAHTVTADDGSFDSGNMDPGKSFTQTFAKAGSVKFHCSIHPNMTGTITVK